MCIYNLHYYRNSSLQNLFIMNLLFKAVLTQRVLYIYNKDRNSFDLFWAIFFIKNTYLCCSFVWLLCWWVFPGRKFINFATAIIQVGVEFQFLGLGQFEASLWQFAKPQLQFFRLLQSCEGLNGKNVELVKTWVSRL